VIRRHLIPNSIGPALVMTARDVGNAVILQATFTFIGMGGTSAWGLLLSKGKDWVIGPGGDLLTYWWVFLPATLAVTTFGVAWNLVGDGLNEALDPNAIGFQTAPVWKRDRRSVEIRSVPMPLGRMAQPVNIAAYFSPENDPVFLLARKALAENDISGAVRAYSHLIERRRWLHEIIQDLANIAQRFPKEAGVWKSLGDALDRVGNTGLAAKAYEEFRKHSK
jgi:hypothetical protein